MNSNLKSKSVPLSRGMQYDNGAPSVLDNSNMFPSVSIVRKQSL